MIGSRNANRESGEVRTDNSCVRLHQPLPVYCVFQHVERTWTTWVKGQAPSVPLVSVSRRQSTYQPSLLPSLCSRVSQEVLKGGEVVYTVKDPLGVVLTV